MAFRPRTMTLSRTDLFGLLEVERFPDLDAWKLGLFTPHQTEHGWCQAQSVVWLFDRDTAADPRRRATGQHQHRVSGFSKKSTVIPAGVEASDVEVPMFAGQNQEIGLD